jgi:hypothetical protein
MPVDVLLSAGMGTVPLAPLADVMPAELPGVIRKMESRLASLKTADAALLWSSSYILAGLRYPGEFIQSLFAGVRAMKESSTYQLILKEGHSAGRAEGRAEEARRILLRIGRKHLGQPAAATLAWIDAIHDVEQLEELAERVYQVKRWDDLGPPRPAKKRKSSEK